MLELTRHQLAELEVRAEETLRGLALPTCSEVLARMAAEVEAPAPDAGRLSSLLAEDVASAGTLLKAVNSALQGRLVPACSVQKAVAYLGAPHTARLFAALLRGRAFTRTKSEAVAARRRASLRLALALGFLGRALGVAPRDEAYTFGLLRDAGQAILACRHPDYESSMSGLLQGDASACTEHEKRQFGVDHAVIGAVLARDWLLPEAMSDAILWHHAEFVLALAAPPIRDDAVRLIALGVLGDRVLQTFGAPRQHRAERGSDEHALRLLGASAREFAQMEAEACALLAAAEGRAMPTMRLQPLRP